MSQSLPVQLDPVLLADRGRSLNGDLPVGAFRRLVEWLHASEGRLTFELAFARDGQQRRWLHGHVRGGLDLLCQRCLGTYRLTLEREFDLVLVSNEAEAATLPEDMEAVVIGDSRDVHTVDLLEDELILALPLIPRCEDTESCRPAVEPLDSERVLAEEEEEEDTGQRQKPFSDLADRVGRGPRKR